MKPLSVGNSQSRGTDANRNRHHLVIVTLIVFVVASALAIVSFRAVHLNRQQHDAELRTGELRYSVAVDEARRESTVLDALLEAAPVHPVKDAKQDVHDEYRIAYLNYDRIVRRQMDACQLRYEVRDRYYRDFTQQFGLSPKYIPDTER